MGSRASSKRQAQSADQLVRTVWARAVKPEVELIAIDPGDQHVGVAFFATNADGEWFCEDAQELEPDEFEDGFAELVLMSPQPPIVVFERFRLYGDKSKEQTGSEFRTSQMIGVIKFVCRTRNLHVDRHDRADNGGKMLACELVGGVCADPANRPHRAEIFGQMADIKKPTKGILNKKGIKSVGAVARRENSGWGIHCVDAELHGWYHILKTMGADHAS